METMAIKLAKMAKSVGKNILERMGAKINGNN
jgi:hypothetical protein